MKPRFWALTLALAMLLGGCGRTVTVTYDQPLVTGAKGQVVAKSASEITAMIDGGQTFVVYVGTGGCETCASFLDVMKKLTDEYAVTVYYMPADDTNETAAINELIAGPFAGLTWTPTTYAVVKGQVADRREKDMTYDDLRQWLLQAGMLG